MQPQDTSGAQNYFGGPPSDGSGAGAPPTPPPTDGDNLHPPVGGEPSPVHEHHAPIPQPPIPEPPIHQPIPDPGPGPGGPPPHNPGPHVPNIFFHPNHSPEPGGGNPGGQGGGSGGSNGGSSEGSHNIVTASAPIHEDPALKKLNESVTMPPLTADTKPATGFDGLNMGGMVDTGGSNPGAPKLRDGEY